MKDKMIFASFLQMSNHMWAGPDTVYSSFETPEPYTEDNRIDLDVWDSYVAFLAERKFNMLVVDVGDGVKLDSHPEIAAPDAWSKEFVKRKLDAVRAAGMEPVPKLNMSAGHNVWQKTWRRQIGTPEYRRFCEEIIAEVADLFDKPSLFHLGMDEEYFVASDGVSMVRNQNVWWRDLYSHFEACEKAGTRPWVWSDYYWHHPDVFEKNMPKSVLQSNWFYHHFRKYNTDKSRNDIIAAYRKLDELGYDQLPTCSCWATNISPLHTMLECPKMITPEHLLGFLTVPWCNTTADNIYTLQNDAHRFYLARKRMYPASF